MAYIGLPTKANFTSGLLDRFTSTTGTTVTLTHDISSENDIVVFVNFVKQDSTTYSVGGTGNKTLTLGGTLVSSDIVEVHYLNIVGQTVNPSANSVGNSQTASSIINGQTAETSIADSDEVLIYDASATALRKMTKANFVSGIGGANTPHFEAYRSGTQAISNGTWTTILFNAEARDTSSVYDTSNGRFTPTTAGKYFCYANVIGGNDGSSSLNYVLAKFFKNGSDYQTTSVFKQDSRGYPGANYTVSACHVIEFNGSSDYLEVKINMDTTVGTPDCVENSNFGAYKIIE